MPIPLIIIGGGAAGLMAAATAAELEMPALLLERRHRLGLKLLMCGNNRCNISHDFSAGQMLHAYGEPVAAFLRPALEAFPPAQLRRWFQKLNLNTVVKQDDRIYPSSEKADDVLHAFADFLRDRHFPYVMNCPVREIRKREAGFEVITENGLSFEADRVLVATGGVSYPKTGSVGDGLKFASALGLKTTPLRAGLVAVETDLPWLVNTRDTDIPDVKVTVADNAGKTVAEIRGNLLCNPGILRGSAVFDATRLCARQNLTGFRLTLDLFPVGNVSLQRLPREVAMSLKGMPAAKLREIPVPVLAVRPLKEAIVTVGGVALQEIDPETMQSRKVPGLYFAGETLDVDGPTGGFNLHAAFATARLAINSMAPAIVGAQPRSKHSGRRENGPAYEKKRERFSPKDGQGRWDKRKGNGSRLGKW